jgi:hypothetical protein
MGTVYREKYGTEEPQSAPKVLQKSESPQDAPESAV